MSGLEHPVRFAGVRGNAVLLAQRFVGAVLRDGCVAVDATMGNGHDTLFLAAAVGAKGRVYAFDIQAGAVATTRQRLAEAGLLNRVTLIHSGHETLGSYLPGGADAFLFNLGYLPGGGHEVTTRPETTAAALTAAMAALNPGGRIGVVVYTGHPGAGEESEAVLEIARGADPHQYGVLKVELANRPPQAPFLILMERVLTER